MGKRAVNLQLSGDVASQANSWGEYLQQYKDGRQYDTGVQAVPRSRTDGSAKAKEATRSFNPITQSDIDPAAAARRTEKENEIKMGKIERAKARRLDQALALGTGEIPKVPIENLNTRVTYNILNHETHPAHLIPKRAFYLTPAERAHVNLYGGAAPAVPAKVYPDSRVEYNVLSNKYKQGNDELVAAERKELLEEAAQKYYKTHYYDVITGKFNADSDQVQYDQQMKMVEANAGKKQAAMIERSAPRVANSEGFCYHILNLEDKKPEAIARMKEKERKKAERVHAAEHGLEAEYTSTRAAQQQLLHRRTANNHVPGGKNFTGMGYNIINGSDVKPPVASEGNNYVRRSCYDTIKNMQTKNRASRLSSPKVSLSKVNTMTALPSAQATPVAEAKSSSTPKPSVRTGGGLNAL